MGGYNKGVMLLVLAVSLLSCKRSEIVVTHLNSDIPYEIYSKNQLTGKVEGEKRTFFESGKLFMKENYTNGKPVGEFVLFCENGEVNERGSYKDGALHGDLNFESCNSKLKYQIEYKMGLVWNVAYILFEDRALDKGTLKNGDGSLNKYDINGRKIRVYSFKEGKKSGWQYMITSTGYMDSVLVQNNLEVNSGVNVDYY